MDVDPLASMRCWEIEFELGGRVYEIPALSAVEWWPVIASGDPSRILDFVVSTPDDPFNLDDLLLSGEVDAKELSGVILDVVEEVAGRSYHASFVLATVAKSQWASVNGQLVQRGFRWEGQPLGSALDAIYAVVIQNLEKDVRTQFLALLDNEAMTTGKARGRASGQIVSEFETMAGPKPKAGAISTGEQSGSGRPKTRTQPRPPRPAAP